MFSYWIPEIRDAGLDKGDGYREAALWLTHGTEIPPEKRVLAAQLSDLILFDFLTANPDRYSGGNIKMSPDGSQLYFMDNTMSFFLAPEGHHRNRQALERTQRFTRHLYRALSRVTLAALERLMSDEAIPSAMCSPPARCGQWWPAARWLSATSRPWPLPTAKPTSWPSRDLRSPYRPRRRDAFFPARRQPAGACWKVSGKSKGVGTMAQESPSKRKIQSGIDELKRLRDEIRQDLRRATLELRDEWRELERKLPDPSGAADQLRGATADVADRLLDELRKFRSRLQRSAVPATGVVGDLMTRPAVTCGVGDSLARAVNLMWEHDIGFLPVIGPDGRLAGTLTDRDSAIAAATRGQRFDDLTVESVMSRQVTSCAPTNSALHAQALMKTNQLRRLPVAEEGRPVGVITLTDLARFSLRSGDEGLPAEEIVQALVTIARPRQSNGNNAG